MRLIMMGTGPFAAPTFAALFHTSHEMAALVTQPQRPSSGKKRPPESPLRPIAREHDVPVFDPVSVNTPEARERLATWKPDLFVVADYGQILSGETLACARLGGVNLHGSLLPKYRGAAPINWAIYHGERETGVTVIHMTPRVDAGPALSQARLEIGPDEDAVELEERLATLGASLVVETIDSLERGEVREVPQDVTQATRAPRLKKRDGQVDWRRTAQQLRDQVRALEPWPKTWTHWHRPAGRPLRVLLGSVEVRPAGGNGQPGEVIAATGDALVIATGEGELVIGSVQPEGKRLLSAAEFLRGYPVQPGELFGPVDAER